MTQSDKMIRLRKLHDTPVRNARIAALVFEVAGILFLAAGLFRVMAATTIQSETMAAEITAVILIGWVLVALGNPVYGWVAAWQRRRITPEILQLTEELLK